MSTRALGSRIKIDVAEDGLAALATVTPGPGRDPGAVAQALADTGVVYGIDSSVQIWLAQSLAEPSFEITDLVIARGLPPTPGKNGKLVYTFEPGLRPGTRDARGTLDFRDRGMLKPVGRGDVLAHLQAAAPGIDGRRVDGDPIPSQEVPPPKFRLGEGARFDEASGTIVARTKGSVLVRKGPFIDVVRHHQHQGDVDLHSGDLKMMGSVTITGNVAHGYLVEATGNVEIVGHVGDGTVLSGSNVLVHGGINGGATGRVVAERDLAAHHVQQAVLYCGGAMSVEADVVGGQLKAKKIRIGKRLRGGQVSAEQYVVVHEAGSPSGTHTLIEVGLPLQLAPAAVARQTIEASRIRRMSRGRVGNRVGGGGRTRAKRGRNSRLDLELEQAEARWRRAAKKAAREFEARAYVEIRGTAHRGVVIKIGTASHVIDETAGALRVAINPRTRRIQIKRIKP